jgi:hypothetical protein
VIGSLVALALVVAWRAVSARFLPSLKAEPEA